MSTTKIADKTTLNNVKNNTTTLLSRGGIKSNGTGDLLVYNPSTESWDTISGGGGGLVKPIIIIPNYDYYITGITVNITHESGLFDVSLTIPHVLEFAVEVNYIGTYTIDFDSPGTLKNEIEIDQIGRYFCNTIVPKVVAFNDSTSWDDINDMLTDYYNNYIDDLSDFWSIGDTKTVHISASTYSPNSSTNIGIPEQDVIFAIADFNHDTLSTSINNHTKAAVTLTQIDCLSVKLNLTNGYGPMTYSSTPLRSWLNSTFMNSLPNDLNRIMKQASIGSAKFYSNYQGTSISSTNSGEYCWILAEPEVTGYTSYCSTVEKYSSTYSYYLTSSNRPKKLGLNATSYTEYLSRSIKRNTGYHVTTSYKYPYYLYFSTAASMYNTDSDLGTGRRGVAPCICL